MSLNSPQSVTGSSPDSSQYKSEFGYLAVGDGGITGQGLYKVGLRYYDPLFGRFISPDPDLSQSPYSYCYGDPVNCVDPTGCKTTHKLTKLANGDIADTATVTQTVNGITTTVAVSTTIYVPQSSSGSGNSGGAGACNSGGADNSSSAGVAAAGGGAVIAGTTAQAYANAGESTLGKLGAYGIIIGAAVATYGFFSDGLKGFPVSGHFTGK